MGLPGPVAARFPFKVYFPRDSRFISSEQPGNLSLVALLFTSGYKFDIAPLG